MEFLEEQDREESVERANLRGEDSDQTEELFVVKEEMRIPSERQLTNGLFIENKTIFHRFCHNLDDSTEIKTTESTTVLEDGTIKHTITAVTKTTVVPGKLHSVLVLIFFINKLLNL